MKAFKYGNFCKTEMSGIALVSGSEASSSACSFLTMSDRRLSSQQRYESVVEVVSEPAILYKYSLLSTYHHDD